MSDITIINASEGNLKNVSLTIPKNKLVVVTGLSGSGKSTLLVDVLYHECQRQYLEAMAFQGIHKPKVERIKGVAPAIVITQEDMNKNPRSTVGTVSDIYTDLRMIYEKTGVRTCPHCGGVISAADCKEETQKVNDQFFVYMYCCKCGKRMEKLTRTFFSFNTQEGACPVCEGLGRVHSLNKENAVNESLTLEAGAISYWDGRYGEYQISTFYAALKHYGVAVKPHTPVCQFDDRQKAILFEGTDGEAVRKAFSMISPPKSVAQGKFEGVFPILWRKLSEKGGDLKHLEHYFAMSPCPSCKGERLGELSRSVTVQGMRLPELAAYSLAQLNGWMKLLRAAMPVEQSELVAAYLLDIETKITRFINVGLGYLTLDRQTITLSSGELKRLRLAAILDSDLSGIIYILDEPTVGLHPKDTAGMAKILYKLRDLENTVLVIEHDPDIMAAADYIIDIGPGSGKHGGEIVGLGTLKDIAQNPASMTGAYLRSNQAGKMVFRKGDGRRLTVKNADKYNLKNVTVSFPVSCLTTVTGPSGSGKSTLIFEVLANGSYDRLSRHNLVEGMEAFSRIVRIEQTAITKMKRSNVATYSEAYAEIRNIFAQTEQAKKCGMTAKHFSFNVPGGRCENCGGLGYVDSNMLFFKDIEVTCPVCNGNQFKDEVLAIKVADLSIKDVLRLSVEDAAGVFAGQDFNGYGKLRLILGLLLDVGLGYLALGQTLQTLSGGEGQRLKLAKELIGGTSGKASLYLLDEPSTGLHPKDVANFLILVNRLVDSGNTVIVVEHNQQIIQMSDWVVDLGPEGGDQGGEVIFTGTPEALRSSDSVTAKYL